MSKSSLLFTIEQWELLRRLRTSGLTREHVCQAYDDLDRIERDLCNIYATSNDVTATNNLIQIQNGTSNVDPLTLAKNLQNFQIMMAKNLAAMNYRMLGSNTSPTPTSPPHKSTTSPTASTPSTSTVQPFSQQVLTNGTLRTNIMSPINDFNSFVLNTFANEIEDEARELEEFRAYVPLIPLLGPGLDVSSIPRFE